MSPGTCERCSNPFPKPCLNPSLPPVPAELSLLAITGVRRPVTTRLPASVGAIAADVGADPDAFVKELVSAALARLAATPRQLGTAARRWTETGHLPADRAEAIDLEARELLAESDPGRPPSSLPMSTRLRVAARMAAVALPESVASPQPRPRTHPSSPTHPYPQIPNRTLMALLSAPRNGGVRLRA
jgi:hypothetical protein